jgi:hypothetical protein
LTKAEPVLPATHQPPPVREAILAVATARFEGVFLIVAGCIYLAMNLPIKLPFKLPW